MLIHIEEHHTAAFGQLSTQRPHIAIMFWGIFMFLKVRSAVQTLTGCLNANYIAPHSIQDIIQKLRMRYDMIMGSDANILGFFYGFIETCSNARELELVAYLRVFMVFNWVNCTIEGIVKVHFVKNLGSAHCTATFHVHSMSTLELCYPKEGNQKQCATDKVVCLSTCKRVVFGHNDPAGPPAKTPSRCWSVINHKFSSF